MPLWHIYCPEGTYSPDDKRALADRITDLYAEYGLPRFLVSVVFQEVPKDSYLIGGEPADDFVRSGSTRSPAGSPTTPGAGG
jgi:phenylpyruvate tautomerase PptA (4-oxalocrotonate tautomerase family)